MKIFILEDNPERMKFFNANLIGKEVFHYDNVDDAIEFLDEHLDEMEYLFLDHDLDGDEMVHSSVHNTGFTLAKYLSDKDMMFHKIIVHSLNPVGAANMAHLLPGCSILPFHLIFKSMNLIYHDEIT